MIHFYKSKPRIAWSITGALVGAIIGLMLIGNFGIASRGQGIGVTGWIFGGLVGAYAGFRFGEWRRGAALKAEQPSHEP